MIWRSRAELAAAVSNAGGLGVISAAGVGCNEVDYKANFRGANMRALADQIRKVREMTTRAVGVNIMVAMSNFADMAQTAVREKIDVIFSGAGLPLDLPSYVHGGDNPKLVPIVSSARATTIICKKWRSAFNRLPDAVVVEGPMAGGHLGFRSEQINDDEYRLEKLVPQVLDAVRPYEQMAGRTIPVIAAGGVYTGADIHQYLSMGASGVQLGTRFVATHECDADEAFKRAYVEAREEDIQIMQSPVGMPGRVVRNRFIERVEAGERKPCTCPYHCLRSCNVAEAPYCIAAALALAKHGKVNQGLLFAGANVHRVDSIVSVRELMRELTEGFEQANAATPAPRKAAS
jgi:nitronate monooxygenase